MPKEGYALVKLYQDVGSGASKRRLGFQQMLRDLQAGEFDVIVCWKSDRLSRGLYPAAALSEALEGTDIRLESVKDTIDRNTFDIMAVVGKIELQNIRERARMGARGRASKGLVSGVLKYGYTIGPDSKPAIRPEEAEVVKQVFAWRASGVGSWEIARRLNEAGSISRNGNPWDDQKLWWIVTEPAYTGRGRYGRRQYFKKDTGDRDVRLTKWMPEDTLIGVEYPRIVDDHTWDLAQLHRQHSTRQRIGTKPRLPFALHGLLWCDHCAAKYTIGTNYLYRRGRGDDGTQVRVRTDKVVRRYVCNKGKRQGGGCPKRSIAAQLVEQVVWDEITRFLTDPTQLRTLINERRQHLEEGGAFADLDSARAKVSEVEQEKGRTINLYTLGHIDEADLDVRLKGVNERLEYYQVEVVRLEAEAANANQALEVWPETPILPKPSFS